MAERKPPGRKTRSKATGVSDNRYEQILQEAQVLIRERGFASVSIRDLADAVGIKVSSLYHYFATKDEILYVLMMRTMRMLLDQTYSALSELGSSDARDRFACLIRVGVLYHTENQTLASIALTEGRLLTGDYNQEFKAFLHEYTDVFKDAIQHGIDDGAFEAEDATMAAFIVLSALTRISLWYHPDGRLSPEEIVEIYITRMLAMVDYKGDATPNGAAPASS